MKSQFLALLLMVSAILNGEEFSLEDYKAKFNAPNANRYYYARLIAESGDPSIRWLLARSPGSDDGELEKALGIGLVYAPAAEKTFFVYGGATRSDARHLLAMVSFYDQQHGAKDTLSWEF